MNEFLFLTQAAGITVSLALCALLLGLLFAVLFMLWESARWKLVMLSGSAIVTILRGVPEILVVLFVYYGSAQFLLLLSDGITLNLYLFTVVLQMEIATPEVSPFVCGVIALALLYSAYASQTLRGALQAIPQEQRQSALVLGLSRRMIFLRIILPQMWRHALPGLGNHWLVLLKDTALVSLISVNDLMLQAQTIAIRTQQPFTWYLIVAAIYLLITLLSQQILTRLERYTTRFERGTI